MFLNSGSRTLDPEPMIQGSQELFWIRDPGSGTLDPGPWIQGPGILDPGPWIQDPGILDPEPWIQGAGSMIQCPGSSARSRALNPGFCIQNPG